MTSTTHHSVSRRQGFSLVELSIVLAILGLLIGGLLAGQSLTRAAKLRSVVADFQQYKAALGHFKDQYSYMPGDLPTATNYWGVLNAVPATCQTTASTDAKTCNGNGDGKVVWQPADPQVYEIFRLWQHLANAGMIDSKQYTGVGGPLGAADPRPGVNLPGSQITGGGFEIGFLGYWVDTNWYPRKWNYVIMFGNETPRANDYLEQPIISAPDAQSIDSKMDDGRPDTGVISTWRNYPSCVVATNDAYALTSEAQACNLIFITGF